MSPAEERFRIAYKLADGLPVQAMGNGFAVFWWEGDGAVFFTQWGNLYLGRYRERPASSPPPEGLGYYPTELAAMVHHVAIRPDLADLLSDPLDELLSHDPELAAVVAKASC